jgi:hypothetical protein
VAAVAAAMAMLALERLLGRAHARGWLRLVDPDAST